MENPKKEKESPELKEELTEEEAKSVDGGGKDATEQSVNNWIDERIHFLDPSA